MCFPLHTYRIVVSRSFISRMTHLTALQVIPYLSAQSVVASSSFRIIPLVSAWSFVSSAKSTTSHVVLSRPSRCLSNCDFSASLASLSIYILYSEGLETQHRFTPFLLVSIFSLVSPGGFGSLSGRSELSFFLFLQELLFSLHL